MVKLAAVLLSLFLAAPADAAIYIVRHGEKKGKAEHALLSRKGKQRAAGLVKVLRSTKLVAVYCTEYTRTCQTAAPAASAHKLSPSVIKTDDQSQLVNALRGRAPEEDVLVVGHSDTIPDLLKALGVETAVEIKADDYDNLFVLTLHDNDPVDFHWLHYSY